MGMVLNSIKQNKNKFLITMIIIIVFAGMINYGVYNIFDIYFDPIVGVELNIIVTVFIISVTTVLMIILLPKDTVNELYNELEGNNNNNNDLRLRTPEQQLQDMVSDEEFEKNNND